uniref:DDE-type integrase/transposase/recombinase n=1 Tax=Enterococcus sp. DIV0849a TaxID=2230879 RepID=UPI00403DB975
MAISTIERSIQVRKPKASVLFHTDQGSQYTSFEFRKFLENHSIVQSLSKSGYPCDNAVTEAFFKYIKKEKITIRNFFLFKKSNLLALSISRDSTTRSALTEP